MLKLNTKEYELKNMTVLKKDHDIFAVFSAPPESRSDDYFFSERVMALLTVEDKAGDIHVIPMGYDREDPSSFDSFLGLINKEDIDDVNITEAFNQAAKENMKKRKVKFTDYDIDEE